MKFWTKIKHGAKIIGDFQARLLLTILYGLLVLPTGLITRIGGDPLESHPGDAVSYWCARTTKEASLRPARRQG